MTAEIFGYRVELDWHVTDQVQVWVWGPWNTEFSQCTLITRKHFFKNNWIIFYLMAYCWHLGYSKTLSFKISPKALSVIHTSQKDILKISMGILNIIDPVPVFQMGACPSQPTCELLPSFAPHQGLYISQFQVKNLGARTKNPRKILPSSNTSKPMALRKILSVVPPHLPQSLAQCQPKNVAFIPLNHIYDWRPNSWTLPCLEPVLHFHPIRLLEIPTSLSSLQAVSPTRTPVLWTLSLGHRQGKNSSTHFHSGQKKTPRKDAVLSTPHLFFWPSDW